MAAEAISTPYIYIFIFIFFIKLYLDVMDDSNTS